MLRVGIGSAVCHCLALGWIQRFPINPVFPQDKSRFKKGSNDFCQFLSMANSCGSKYLNCRGSSLLVLLVVVLKLYQNVLRDLD